MTKASVQKATQFTPYGRHYYFIFSNTCFLIVKVIHIYSKKFEKV